MLLLKGGGGGANQWGFPHKWHGTCILAVVYSLQHCWHFCCTFWAVAVCYTKLSGVTILYCFNVSHSCFVN